MARASSTSRGLAIDSPSSTTVLSAAMKYPCRPLSAAADASAFSRDKRRTMSVGVSPGNWSSGMLDGATSNCIPKPPSSSRRRGDADARIMRLVSGLRDRVATHSMWCVWGNISTGWTDSMAYRRHSVRKSLARDSGLQET